MKRTWSHIFQRVSKNKDVVSFIFKQNEIGNLEIENSSKVSVDMNFYNLKNRGR